MAFFINKQPSWLVKALDRSPNEDSGVPNFVPDTISPSVDVFGWEALQRQRTGTNSAAAGVEEVFPQTDVDWPSGIGAGGVVPRTVALRIITSMHIQHNGFVETNLMWFGVVDRESPTTSVGIPTETGPATLIAESVPLNITRPIFLRPLEYFVGRVRGLNAAATLQINYTWIDLKEGEYIPHIW